MDNGGEAGVFLSLNDCGALYPRFKENESFLSEDERKVLLRIEKLLYRNLSIGEMEELLERGSARPGAAGRG
jgi:hypothetical protein